MGLLLSSVFWFHLAFTGVYCSFIPYTLTGLAYRVSGCLLFSVWALGTLRNPRGPAFLSHPVILAFLLLCLPQWVTVLSCPSPSLSRDFL
ncbi:MAG: hypothetical protein HQL31_12025, partial [Planctomycetes bacterium]|nr:hypothetical protein [Planctomycetota bacterium]